ncbi:GntR family transcriptional regulator, partial [Pseudomonas putida]
VAILPRRGAHVTELDERSVRSLCALMGEFYILLGNAVAQKWRTDADLRPFLEIQQRLQRAHDQLDIKAFVADSFAVMRAAYPFADNPFLQETVENLQPAMSRAYYLSLDQRQASMIDYLDLFARLLDAVIARDLPRIREVLTAYGQRSCELVLAALARG